MSEVFADILNVLVTVVIIPLFTYGGTQLIKLLNNRAKNERTKNLLLHINDIILKVVKFVSQTYVDSLKVNGKFDKKAQEDALNRVRENVLYHLNDEEIQYIKNLYGDSNRWLDVQIESTIKTLKECQKNE